MGRGSALQEFVFSLGGGSGASEDDPWLVGAGIGYSKNTDERYQNRRRRRGQRAKPAFPRAEQFQELQARRPGLGRVCASIKHKPTGLFLFSAFSFSETNDTNTHPFRFLHRHQRSTDERLGRRKAAFSETSISLGLKQARHLVTRDRHFIAGRL